MTQTSKPTALTQREKQVLELVAQFCLNPEIASRLGISPQTVRTHIENLRKKSGTHSRVQLILFATGSRLSPASHNSPR